MDPGAGMHALIARLYPICRSITGDGVRETLRILQERAPIEIREVPTGTAVFDWTVPQEWNIRDAYIKDSRGNRVVDFRAHNLHVLNYSTPVHATLSLAELRSHLYSDPAHPDRIPYRTSYYQPNWGFCLPHARAEALPDDRYEVMIDATLADGSLTYGECFLPGSDPEAGEVLMSAHVCHPSLANDNLSGIAVAAALIGQLREAPHRLGYRFLFVPGTIGSITWLARNEARLGAIRHGLVLANLGDPGPLHYKRSRRGAAIDRAAAHVLGRRDGRMLDFTPYGYDERQYCSPGLNLPVGCLSRTPWGRFPEYHTSADDLGFVRPEALADSLDALAEIVGVLERDRAWRNLMPKGEPQLGRRGLYDAIGGRSDAKARQMAMLWVLNMSDGTASVLDIAERAGLGFALVADAAETLAAHGLLA
jgi:aminopeptidase-like protein